MKLEYSRQIFEKYANIKFHENPSSWSRVVPCGETDRHDEANSRFSQFCERVPISTIGMNFDEIENNKISFK
jgi:hypothetical protein